MQSLASLVCLINLLDDRDVQATARSSHLCVDAYARGAPYPTSTSAPGQALFVGRLYTTQCIYYIEGEPTC